MPTTTKSTPLNAWHRSRGAKMGEFGGYDMPIWYASARDEHLAVLTRAGLFDTSHMAAVALNGAGARDLLQETFSQDLDACIGKARQPLGLGRCVYGVFLDADGRVIDDSIVYQFSRYIYVAIVNAGSGSIIAGHLNAQRRGPAVDITDMSDRLGKIDLQGPCAARIMARLLADPDKVLSQLPYFGFKGSLDAFADAGEPVRLAREIPIWLSRTGYTGEFGFEIFLAPENTMAAWEMLLDAGSDFGLLPCGLAARDSLRGGAGLPLSHQDIGPWPFVNNPWTFVLPYTADRGSFSKSFIGSQSLLRAASSADFTQAFIGKDPRKVSLSDPAVVLDERKQEIGRVLTCVTDMGIDLVKGRVVSVASPEKPERFEPRGLSCGFVKVRAPLATGTTVWLQDKRRSLGVTLVDDIRPHRTARRPMRDMLAGC